jgi:hypothetical protein
MPEMSSLKIARLVQMLHSVVTALALGKVLEVLKSPPESLKVEQS